MIKSVEEGIYYIFMWTPHEMIGLLPAPFNIENMMFHRFTIRSLLFCVRLCHVLHIHPLGFEQYVTAIPPFLAFPAPPATVSTLVAVDTVAATGALRHFEPHRLMERSWRRRSCVAMTWTGGLRCGEWPQQLIVLGCIGNLAKWCKMFKQYNFYYWGPLCWNWYYGGPNTFKWSLCYCSIGRSIKERTQQLPLSSLTCEQCSERVLAGDYMGL